LVRHYFAIPTNSGEQAHSFMTLCAWLIQQAGGSFDKPQEVSDSISLHLISEHFLKFALFLKFDDPNTVISGILNQLRKYVKF
jgi:hypothetical protein